MLDDRLFVERIDLQAEMIHVAPAGAGFSGDDIDMQGGLLAELTLRGVPEDDAATFAEGVRRGGAVVCVRADDEQEASEAADLMREHGALDIEACRAGWRGREQVQPD